MSNFVNITQEQWEELTETVRTASQRAELWAKEREGLVSMLGAAKEALVAAQNNAQAADQQSQELMGLYSWAGVSRGSRGSRGTKVEIFQDPGSYDSSASKFEEWWTKINAWLECHLKQFQEKGMQEHDVPTLKPQMYVVLSRLKGLKGAHYAKMVLKSLPMENHFISTGSSSPPRLKEFSTHSCNRTGLATH